MSRHFYGSGESSIELDGQMRGHSPPYGVRFWASARLVGEVSICWRCNNMFGTFSDASFHREFAETSDEAKELYALCSRALGHAPDCPE